MSEPIEPGTKLPWYIHRTFKNMILTGGNTFEVGSPVTPPGDQDAAYIVHACNSYPQLVAKLAELEKPCVWSYDDVHGKWDGACGIGWYFFESDETPTGHGMNYCPRCQHPITEEPTEGNE